MKTRGNPDRGTVLSQTLGRLPPPRETAADLARVMLLLDASTIARNVGHDLIFATSCRTHSDLGGCADSVADALPAVNNTVKGVAAGERRAELGRREGGEKGPTMSENTWQDERLAACENGIRQT
jgi:hypothetical protein